jgi:arabinogalactan endo-1,4-beta-galactosidase
MLQLRRFFIAWTAIGLAVCSAAQARAEDFAFGADLSFLRQAEAHGAIFKDAGVATPGLQIFRRHHYNWIRLRLFVEPVQEHLPNDLAYTLAEAQEAKKLGFKFLLDLHYASSWADPAKQPTPARWKNLSHAGRVAAVRDYTRDTIAAFRAGGALPDMVQIGNEITHGMLWPDGRIPEHWDHFADYLRAGIAGVEGGAGASSRPRILLQFAEDGKPASTQYFFDKINSDKIPFDVIGFSYYPSWHGSLDDLRANLAFAAQRYHKPVFVVETAYYWKPNSETRGKTIPFLETPQGQRDFLDAVTRIVKETPDGLGQGVFWWEPAVTGGLAARGFFDSSGAALPVLGVFDHYAEDAPHSR